jgi:hypothetical protein
MLSAFSEQRNRGIRSDTKKIHSILPVDTHRMMTSRAARRASIATIPQAHLAETYLVPHLTYTIISNNTFHDKIPFNTMVSIVSPNKHLNVLVKKIFFEYFVLKQS